MRILALALSLSLTIAPRIQAQDAERTAVLATVQKLWDAMRTRDTMLLKQAFDSSARLMGVSMPRGGTGAQTISVTTPSQFGAAITRNPAGPVWNERMYDPQVHIDDNLAHVWTYYTFHSGTTFSHCGIDAITLLKVSGVWKITHIADSRRTTGCTHTTPGNR